MHCACTKRPYFHFRSKIWRHHRVPQPRFLKRRENFGYSRTFNADIELLNTCMGFRTSWPKTGLRGQNRGRGSAILTPSHKNLFFWVLTSVPILVKMNQEMRPRECPQTDTQIHWQTDRRKPIFTALHAMQTRSSDENSVCPSVCPSVRLSVTRVDCDKTVERSVEIYIPYERTLILVFWEEEWLVGGDPF